MTRDVGLFSAEVDGEHLGAFAYEYFSTGTANALASTCDHGNFARQHTDRRMGNFGHLLCPLNNRCPSGVFIRQR